MVLNIFLYLCNDKGIRSKIPPMSPWQTLGTCSVLMMLLNQKTFDRLDYLKIKDEVMELDGKIQEAKIKLKLE